MHGEIRKFVDNVKTMGPELPFGTIVSGVLHDMAIVNILKNSWYISRTGIDLGGFMGTF